MRRRLVGGLVGSFVLAGCVAVPVGDGEAGGIFLPDGGFEGVFSRTQDRGGDMAFVCSGDREIRVDFDRDGERAYLRTDRRDYELVLVDRNRDAYVFESRGGDDVQLSVNEDEAYLRIEDEDDYKDCRRANAFFGGRDRSDRRRGGFVRDNAIVYRCDGGRGFVASFDRGGYATVELGGRAYDLDLVSQRGRAQVYADGDIELSVERGGAYLRVEDGNDYKDCRAERR